MSRPSSTAAQSIQAGSIIHPLQPKTIDKVLVKAVRKGKKEAKTFTIRNVNPLSVMTRGQVQNLIKECLQGDIISGNFDVGFINGVNVIRVRTREDVKEMLSEIEKAKSNTMLWCDGLVDNERKSATSGRKRKS